LELRSDHVAGGAFLALGVAVFAMSGELPFGTLTQPGAGMMPKLMAGLMMLFAVAMMTTSRDSPRFAGLDWSDAGHAGLVVAITAIGIASYVWLGFIITMTLLVVALLVAVERKSPLYAVPYALVLVFFAWWLFGKALKAPLERGVLGI
jgi:hypothetical protein